MNAVEMYFSISETKKQANAKLAFANILKMETTRIKRLRKLISENFEGSQTDLSKKSGVSLSQLGQYLSGYRTLGEKTARKIEAACGKEHGWLDQENEKNQIVDSKKQQHPLIQQVIDLMESTDDQGKQLVLIRAEEIIAERRAHLRKIMMAPPLIPMETSAIIERTKTKVEEK